MEHKKVHKKFLPIINRGTWSRVYAIKNTVERILSKIDPADTVNIINLGAGLDTLYFLLKQNYNNFKYFEFDYDDITFKKLELIKKSQLLKDMICKENFEENVKILHGNLNSDCYNLFACDVCDKEKINEKLVNCNLFNRENLTIVISECLLVYLSKETTVELLKNFTDNLKNVIFLEYDLVNSQDSFGKEMVENLHQRNIKLLAYDAVPTAQAQIDRLIESGFEKAECYDMLDYYNNVIDPNEKKRIESLEFLDEFEEWNLMQSHSCFGYGAKLESKYSFLYDDVLKMKK
jgi:tRNA wybutosine-synthesizing protein 4